MLVRPGSDYIRPHEDLCKYDSIPVMFPVTFPVTFHFRPHNPDTSVGSRSVPQSDRSKISDFPRYVGRVRSLGLRGRSRVGPTAKAGSYPTGIPYQSKESQVTTIQCITIVYTR